MLVAQDVIYVPSNRHHVADTNIHQISVTIAWKIAIVVTTQYLVKVFVVHNIFRSDRGGGGPKIACINVDERVLAWTERVCRRLVIVHRA